MQTIENSILNHVNKRDYRPVKPRVLARKLGLSGVYDNFKKALRDLVKAGRVEFGKDHAVRPVGEHGTVVGVFRKGSGDFGFVRPHAVDGTVGAEIYIAERDIGDASTGDEVVVRIRSMTGRGGRGPRGSIVRVVQRATKHFVGTYFEREGTGHVRVDGTVFAHSVVVGDPGAKGAKPNDKVVFEMIRFPSLNDRGEGVITEILGPRGQPGVDTLSIIRTLGLPDAFPEDVLEEARQIAQHFREDELHGREDLTGWLTITIDPIDARDFDDAISLSVDPKSKHWQLGVHIADVGAFVPVGSALDREARKRATSVYLPQRVLPMFPEILSNGLASLQQGKVRLTKSVLMDMTPAGQRAHVRLANSAIKVRRRFTYEQVSEILARHDAQEAIDLEPDILDLLLKTRELAIVLKKRRVKRGALELDMPEVELEYDADGKLTGAHLRKHDISHQMIEECMLAANEAVAEHLDDQDIAFLRRVHPAPEPNKLKAFAEFARLFDYKIKQEQDRFALQRVLKQSAQRPEARAVHYALLRSLKQATYSPIKDDHYALASENYCHFTSPIRRYPDLTVHRLLDQLFKRGKVGSDFDELVVLGDHCSKMERRAEVAERELVKHKLLTYVSERIGSEWSAIITGVADYGFYAQADTIPIEGLVHISTLPGDYYYFEEHSHSLIGQRTQRRYRLGDTVRVKAVHVDLNRRQLDFRLVAPLKKEKTPAEAPVEHREKPSRERVRRVERRPKKARKRGG
jgi:ribonuclease R